jgi:23S rRNA pseudouridine1911/1915/1917 synthase
MTERADAFSIIADKAALGRRIDAYLATKIEGCSRAYIAGLIRSGQIRLHDRSVKPGYRLRPGDEILGRIPAPSPRFDVSPEPIPLDILFQDRDLVVINKPADLVVHPAPGHPSGTLVNALLHHCPDLVGIAGEIRPGIVHRLDKDTTGIIVAAKNPNAQASLAAQFKSRSIQKKYLAVVHGEMEGATGRITLPIGRHPVDRKKMSTRATSARRAETHWTVAEAFTEASLIDIDLLTGRTHQIRVHFAAIRHAVIGDPLYGPKNAAAHSPRIAALLSSIQRQMLHAWQIRFRHPASSAELHFKAPLPQDMANLIQSLRTLHEGP